MQQYQPLGREVRYDAMALYWRVDVQQQSRHQLGMSNQLHASANLLPGERTPVTQ
jgi:hypothetical protein